MVEHRLSALEIVLDAHPHVLGNGLAFLLGQRGHDGDEKLAAGAHGVNVFLFKQNRDIQGLEPADVLETVQGVAGEAADGFGDDHVNFAVLAVADHAVEFFPLLGGSAAYTLIRVDIGQHPVGIFADYLAVVGHLGLIAGFLLL